MLMFFIVRKYYNCILYALIKSSPFFSTLIPPFQALLSCIMCAQGVDRVVVYQNLPGCAHLVIVFPQGLLQMFLRTGEEEGHIEIRK